MHFIIGTAGHVDHGKTTLIRALTGIETDRLREEKERGLSIVPGFAHLTLPPLAKSAERIVGIVDVPGHERFLKNMLSGVSGVDVAMLVVAADEGVMPQTMEHLRVLELLRVRRGVLVLTKCDAVDEEWLVLAREDVRTRLKDTLFASAPLVEVSAQNGAGLEELKQTLARLCADLESQNKRADGARPFRLAIDRAFTVSGFGTVVTGSAADGIVTVGDNLDVWQPGRERPQTARVRAVEVHGSPASHAERGQRTALNLAGTDLDEAARGGTLAAPGTLRAVRQIEVWLQCVADAPRPLKDKAPLRLHFATTELEARLSLHSATRLQPGENGYARLRLDVPLSCARGDRFVLREVATERVVGGGVVLDLIEAAGRLTRRQALEFLPPLHHAVEKDDDIAITNILLRRAKAAGLEVSRLKLELRRFDLKPVLQSSAESGVWRSNSGDDAILLHAEVAAELREQIFKTLGDFHAREPLQAAMNREIVRAALPSQLPGSVFDALLSEMAATGKIALEAAGARLSSHKVTLKEDEARIKKRIEELAYQAAFQPLSADELSAGAAQNPDEAELARQFIFALLREGTLVRLGEFAISARRLDEGAALLRTHLQEHATLSVAQAREVLNSTRKWLVPLLEHYDRIGVTRRNGDVRILR